MLVGGIVNGSGGVNSTPTGQSCEIKICPSTGAVLVLVTSHTKSTNDSLIESSTSTRSGEIVKASVTVSSIIPVLTR